jgi:hypothetical protein
MVNPKLKNLIRKIVLKEADDYLQDFSSFGDDKNRLRQYLTTKNLSNTSIGPKSLTNFPSKSDELSLFSVNIRDLNPVERSMLKQSLSNGNIQHKVESGVVSFSKKDFNKIRNEVVKLIEDEYEHAQDLYKEYFSKNGDTDYAGNVKPNEKTKRYEQKLFLELKKVQNIANNLFQNMVNTIDNNYSDESLYEAYVDTEGELQDFDFFMHSKDTSPSYDSDLKRGVNRFKAIGGGVVLKLDIDKDYHKNAFRRVLQMAIEQGIPMGDKRFKLPRQGAFTLQKIGKTDKYTFSSKYSIIIKTILKEIATKENKTAYKELLDMIR